MVARKCPIKRRVAHRAACRMRGAGRTRSGRCRSRNVLVGEVESWQHRRGVRNARVGCDVAAIKTIAGLRVCADLPHGSSGGRKDSGMGLGGQTTNASLPCRWEVAECRSQPDWHSRDPSPRTGGRDRLLSAGLGSLWEGVRSATAQHTAGSS